MSCLANAELSQGQCSCSSSYEGTSKCKLKPFFASIKLDNENNVLLWFNDDLATSLSYSKISLSLEKFSTSFNLIEMNLKSYKIEIELNEELSSKTKGMIKLSDRVVSKNNAKLRKNEFEFEISPSSSYKVEKQINNTFAQIGKTNFYSGASVTAFISIFSFNYVSFWNFLNAIQFIVYLRLVDVSIPMRFDNLIKAMTKITEVFNVFEYFIPESRENSIFPRLHQFGFKTFSIFYNAGHWLTLLMLIVLNHILVSIYFKIFTTPCKINFIEKKLKSLKESFKYSS